MKKLLRVALLGAAVAVPGAVWAQAPSITSIVPSAVAPGQTADVTFHGANLAGAGDIWLSFPGKAELAKNIEKNGTEAAMVVYRITPQAQVPPGIYAVRLATGKGVSNVRFLMVDDLPTLAEDGKNKSPQSAQELNLPVAVDGACEPESYDFYKFTAAKGQRVTVEAVARRLGSPMDPVFRILDEKGRQLAYSDDDPGVGVDSRASLTIPADGTYLIEVRDIQYAGSANHRYRLRVGDFPLVTAPYPLAVQRGESATLAMAGESVENVGPQTVAAPKDNTAEALAIAAKFTSGQGSAMAHVQLCDLPVALEAEPNDEKDKATAASVPAIINGRFEKDRDRDFYRFAAKKGERLQFTGITRTAGSPCYLFLQLYAADGAKLAEVEDPGTAEASFNHTFAADGDYFLLVEELTYTGGPGHVYAVRIEPYRPGFSLALDADKFDPPQGGVFTTKVTAVRRDYKGPITLSLEGVEGAKLASNVIAEGKNDTTLQVTLPEKLSAGQLLACRVVGTAKVGEEQIKETATVTAALQKQYPGMIGYPSEAMQTLALGIGPVFPDFFKLKLEPDVVLLPQLVGTSTFKVKAEKLDKFDDAISLKLEGLPEGVTAQVKPIEKGKAEAVVTLKGPETLALGEHRFKLVGSATFQNQPKSVVLSDVVLKVSKPLAVKASAAGALTAGGKQKVKVTVTRYGDHKEPVTLAWKNLPPGVTAPSSVVPEGKNEVEIELLAAADAAATTVDNVGVVAITKVKDHDVVVESSPLKLEVKSP